MKHSYFSRRLLSVFMAFALGLSVLLAKDFVVVIDAGHGGHDPGSLGSKAKEKNINLGVALKLGRLIENNMQGVKVVYTRKKDVYLTLQERANIANKVQGDLFISIHWIKNPPIVGKSPALLLGHWGYTEARRT